MGIALSVGVGMVSSVCAYPAERAADHTNCSEEREQPFDRPIHFECLVADSPMDADGHAEAARSEVNGKGQ
jgi:hypothetical protein